MCNNIISRKNYKQRHQLGPYVTCTKIPGTEIQLPHLKSFVNNIIKNLHLHSIPPLKALCIFLARMYNTQKYMLTYYETALCPVVMSNAGLLSTSYFIKFNLRFSSMYEIHRLCFYRELWLYH